MTTWSQVTALTVRSLRTDARSTYLHAMRGGLAALLWLAIIALHLAGGAFGAPGLKVYSAVVTIDFLFIGVLGASLFAQVITEEKADGSLDLMRMADLGATSILLGKSIGQLVAVVSLLVVQLPFVLLAVALGGVTIPQITVGFAVLGAWVLLCYASGLLASSVCRTNALAGRASLAILTLLSLWPAVPMAVGRIASGLGFTAADGAFVTTTERWFQAGWSWTVPGALQETLATGFTGSAWNPAVVSCLAFAAVFVLGAWLGFDRADDRTRREASRRRAFLGFDPWGGKARVPRWSVYALMWKDYRLFVGGRRGIAFRFAAYFVALLVLAAWLQPTSNPSSRETFGVAAIAVVAVGIVLDLGSLAGRVFRDEIDQRTYTTLRSLPKSVGQIAYGKVYGCLTAVIPALVFLVPASMLSHIPFLVVFGPPVAWFIAHLFLLLHLIAWLSLRLPRGAFPLTTIVYVGFMYGSTVLFDAWGGPGAACAFQGFILVLCISTAAKLQQRIGDELVRQTGLDG